VLRQVVPKAQVGITLNLDHLWPASDTDADRSAAHWLDGHHNRWFLGPLFHGAYPQDMVDQWHKIMPPVQDGDMESIAVPIDFLGVNYYTSSLVAAGLDGEGARQVPQAGTARTDMDWEIRPDGLREVLVRVARDYAPRTIYITENGAAFPDVVDHNGRVLDVERRDFLAAHVAAAAQAVEAKVPLRGYLVWALLDNFEWSWATGGGSGSSTSTTPPRNGHPRPVSIGTGTSSQPSTTAGRSHGCDGGWRAALTLLSGARVQV